MQIPHLKITNISETPNSLLCTNRQLTPQDIWAPEGGKGRLPEYDSRSLHSASALSSLMLVVGWSAMAKFSEDE